MPLFDRLGQTLADAARLTSVMLGDKPAQPAWQPPEETPGNVLPRPEAPQSETKTPPTKPPREREAPSRPKPAPRAKPPQQRAPSRPKAPSKPKSPTVGVRPAGSKRPPAGVRPAGSKPPPKTAKSPARKGKKKKAAAEAPANLHRQVLDALHHAVLVVSPGGEVLYANRAMCRQLSLATERSWTPEQLQGVDLAALKLALPASGGGRPRVDAAGELTFLAWDTQLLDERGQPVATVLEKVPVGFDPGER